MAALKTAAVTAYESGILRKSAYRGNVQCIPVELDTDADDGSHTITFSEVLPPNTELIAINLETTAISDTGETMSIGYTGDSDAIINAESIVAAGSVVYPGIAATAGAGAPVDVGGKAIIGELEGTMSSDTIYGYILIVTDE